jgi:hypothetical protein
MRSIGRWLLPWLCVLALSFTLAHATEQVLMHGADEPDATLHTMTGIPASACDIELLDEARPGCQRELLRMVLIIGQDATPGR